jgi:hypothetical protein
VERLQAYAKASSERGALVPVPQLEDDVEAFLEDNDRFAMVWQHKEGPLQVVELLWKGSGAFGDLCQDVFSFLAEVGHLPIFVDMVEHDTYLEFAVVTGSSPSARDPDTHALCVVVKGDSVEALIEWKRREFGGA